MLLGDVVQVELHRHLRPVARVAVTLRPAVVPVRVRRGVLAPRRSVRSSGPGDATHARNARARKSSMARAQ